MALLRCGSARALPTDYLRAANGRDAQPDNRRLSSGRTCHIRNVCHNPSRISPYWRSYRGSTPPIDLNRRYLNRHHVRLLLTLPAIPHSCSRHHGYLAANLDSAVHYLAPGPSKIRGINTPLACAENGCHPHGSDANCLASAL